jgi:hypothetical protein
MSKQILILLHFFRRSNAVNRRLKKKRRNSCRYHIPLNAFFNMPVTNSWLFFYCIYYVTNGLINNWNAVKYKLSDGKIQFFSLFSLSAGCQCAGEKSTCVRMFVHGTSSFLFGWYLYRKSELSVMALLFCIMGMR